MVVTEEGQAQRLVGLAHPRWLLTRDRQTGRSSKGPSAAKRAGHRRITRKASTLHKGEDEEKPPQSVRRPQAQPPIRQAPTSGILWLVGSVHPRWLLTRDRQTRGQSGGAQQDHEERGYVTEGKRQGEPPTISKTSADAAPKHARLPPTGRRPHTVVTGESYHG
jgi:hypothetical protein